MINIKECYLVGTTIFKGRIKMGKKMVPGSRPKL